MAGGGSKKHTFIIILLVLLVIGVIGNHARKNDSTGKNITASVTARPTSSTGVQTTTKPTATNSTVIDVTAKPYTYWIQYYKDKNIDVIRVPADVLFEYGMVYKGKTIITVIEVDSKGSRTITAYPISNNRRDSIDAAFADTSEISTVREGTKVIVAGNVSDITSHTMTLADYSATFNTLMLKDCHIISTGISENQIEAQRGVQIKYAESQAALVTQADINSNDNGENEYMKSCVTVDYTDVERNPNQYKGKKIKISGKVIQVSEGWFNSVTLRVDQGNNQIWYVTYTRSDNNESRILENDQLTFYGECDGVESYKTIIGNQVTIPSIKAKYYK